ncbi:MAG: formylmethanofuran dehydrogenase [Thermodesulfobacteria bacterium]|nr:formylmethanofuran dehydrogenase [Thermodesulfobacteriota bacterium]
MSNKTFDELLKESVAIHGHLCPGQVLGVRLAMYGLSLLGIEDPKGKDRKRLMVFVEIDRCATDAIQSVTGCSLGKRSLKWVDYGIMAATFLDLSTNRAIRIIAREESRQLAAEKFPDMENKYKAQIEAYKVMDDEELFKVQEVEVEVPEADMPGRPGRRVQCQKCGDWVQDFRDVEKDGKILCKACAFGAYYKVV